MDTCTYRPGGVFNAALAKTDSKDTHNTHVHAIVLLTRVLFARAARRAHPRDIDRSGSDHFIARARSWRGTGREGGRDSYLSPLQ